MNIKFVEVIKFKNVEPPDTFRIRVTGILNFEIVRNWGGMTLFRETNIYYLGQYFHFN